MEARLLVCLVTMLVGTIRCSMRFPLTMPYVSPQLPNNESYLCTGVAVQADTPLYITGFSPLASQHTVHHLMVIGCAAPVSGVETNLWNCGGSLMETQLESPGSTCPGSQTSQVLYMWSLDGDSLLFPPDVSLTVGGDSGIQHLVLQVHYISKDRIPQHGDTSGVLVSYQSQPTPYSAGIVSLHVHGVVPGGQEPAMWDSACRLLGSTPVQPWAYLGHTHKLGHLVTGWQVSENMTWTQLAAVDPQLPQSFNPILADNLLFPEDILAARCVMVPDQSKDVVQGLASDMEMCDLFIYFFTSREEFSKSPVGQQCTNKGPPGVSWSSMGLQNIPAASLLSNKHFE